MKETAREAMRKMSEENKRKLLESHSPCAGRTAPIRPSKTGPEGGLSTLKRFSLASVGWSTLPVDLTAVLKSPDGMPDSGKDMPSTLDSSSATPEHMAPSSWTSWWSAASTMTGTSQVSEGARDTPSFYVEQLASR